MNNYDSTKDFEYELSNCTGLYGQSILLSGNITGHGIIGRLFNSNAEAMTRELIGILRRLYGNINQYNFKTYFRYYVIKVGLDHIYRSLLETESEDLVNQQMEMFLHTNNERLITTNNKAANVAITLGADRIKDYFRIPTVYDNGKLGVTTSKLYLAKLIQSDGRKR